MHVISKKRLDEFWQTHADAQASLLTWHATAKRATWNNLVDVWQTYPSADAVDRWTIFNIHGNRYRLVTVIHYNRQKIYVRSVLTHAEYDRGDWKRG